MTIPSRAALAVDPSDLAPMLIRAGWLEGRGDAIGAAALRSLPGAGIPSLHALALGAALDSAPRKSDQFEPWYGFGLGDGLADEGGAGYGFEIGSGAGAGGGDGFEEAEEDGVGGGNGRDG